MPSKKERKKLLDFYINFKGNFYKVMGCPYQMSLLIYLGILKSSYQFQTLHNNSSIGTLFL